MEDNKISVPYIVYESEAARHERTVKRLLTALLISILLMDKAPDEHTREELRSIMDRL